LIAPLAHLAARRCARPAAVLTLAAAAAALALQSNGAAALLRREAWLVLGALALTLLTHATARLSAEWRERDADAFGGAPRTRLELAATLWLGAWLAGAAGAALLALFAEVRAAENASAPRELGRVELVAFNSAGEDVRWSTRLAPPSDARALELELGFVATDVAATVELRARRGPFATRTQQVISAPKRVAVELPAGAGEVEFELVRTAGAGVVYSASGAALWLADAANARLASVMFAANALVGLAAWCALALALGGVLPASLAAATALALSVPSALGEHPAWRAWTPWGGVFEALAALEVGHIPAAPGLDSGASAVLLCALALGGAARGLTSWRSAR